jgi:hypothetical protein
MLLYKNGTAQCLKCEEKFGFCIKYLGRLVKQLVKALWNEKKGHGADCPLCHWSFRPSG